MKKLSTIKNYSNLNKVITGISIVLFARIRTVLLFAFKTATPHASIGLENGTLSRIDLAIYDTTASGSTAMKLRAASTTSPSRCATGEAYLWSNLELCGWPGFSNTGYLAGQVFTEPA